MPADPTPAPERHECGSVLVARWSRDWPVIRAMFRPAFSRMGGAIPPGPNGYRMWRRTCLLAFMAGLAASDPYWSKYA